MKLRRCTVVVLLCASLFVTAALNGCARVDPLRGFIGSYRNYTTISGTIQEGRYTSPQTNFSCRVPDLMKPGAVIKDDVNKKEGAGIVAFGDDMGLRFAVRWFEISPDGRSFSDPVLLKGIAEFMEAEDRKSLPKAIIEPAKSVDSGTTKQPALFYIATGEVPGVKVWIPPAQRESVTKEMITPRVFRGHLLLHRGNWVYAITTQCEDKFGADKKKTLEKQERRLRSEIEKLLEGIEFK